MTEKRVYEDDLGVNWSTLKYMKVSPLDYLHAKLYPTTAGDSAKLGSLIDCALLTPDELPERYAVVPEVKWRNKTEKAETVKIYMERFSIDSDSETLLGLTKSEFSSTIERCLVRQGKIPVPFQGGLSDVFTYSKAMAIVEANKDKSAFREVMKAATGVQQELYAICPETGIPLKGKVDIVTSKALMDLKTIGTLGKMFYNIRQWDYLGQLAFYDYLLELNGQPKLSHWIVWIETCSPYKMRLMEIDIKHIRTNRETNLGLLKKLAWCMENDSYPDGSEEALIYEFREDVVEEQASWESSHYEQGEESL